MKFKILFLFLFLSKFLLSQVLITTSNYSQNFGTSTIATWTNNSTFTGWYLGVETGAAYTFNYAGTENITSALPSNVGGFYTYECNNDNNIKLGSRPSNTSSGTAGTGKSHIGVRFRNNTTTTIQSITLDFDAFQLSLSENDGNINKLTLSYQVAPSLTSLTTGTWTNVTAGDYTAPNNDTGGNSAQLNSYQCTVSEHKQICIDVSIPVNSEIIIRWTDLNNNANDPHLAIDNIGVLFHFDDFCAVTLPIELINFIGYVNNEINHLEWFVASERDNDYYTIEKSIDGLKWQEISKINGYGTTTQEQHYYSYDNNVEKVINYYKLSQTDFNGVKTDLKIIAIDNRKPNKTIIRITDIIGRDINIENNNELKIIYYGDGTNDKRY